MEQIIARLESCDLGLDLRIDDLASGEIDQLHMVLRVKHDVPWLQITVDDLLCSKILKSHDDLRCEVLGKLVLQATILAPEEILQAATHAVLHKQV